MKVTAELAPQDTLLANITSPFAVVTRDTHVNDCDLKVGSVLMLNDVGDIGCWCTLNPLTIICTKDSVAAGRIYAQPAKSITLTA